VPEETALPTLHGVRCARCGRVAVPVQDFGCERCGAHGADLAATELSGAGRVLAAVTVHEHPLPQAPTPAVIGSVLLDEGPVLRAMLVDAAGVVVAGEWSGRDVVVGDGTQPRGPVVFVPAGADR
jgi:uncharacterized OB-fold protein